MSAAPHPDEVPPPGAVIAGKYEVVRTLGYGGMGVVVQARHLRMDWDVALKLLRPVLREQPEVVARFEREGRAVAQLRDEHVCRVLDVDTLVDGSPFIVMELLRGEDLADILHAQGKVPFRDAVGYVLEACSAMREAHGAGIVHRDLKPNNLFVDRQGPRPVLKVLDFGISKVTGDVSPSMTATATAFGTPLYMSPEQVRSAKSVDGRADIWSLGVVLYELVAGVSPFAAESPTGILAAIIADAPVPVGEHCADLPRPLAEAVMRALEKDPAARFPDVESFAAALAPFGPGGEAALPAASLPPAAKHTPAAPRPAAATTNAPLLSAAPPPPPPRGLPVAPIAGLLLAVAAGVALLVVAVRRPAAHPPAHPEPTAAAAPPAPVAPVVSPVSASADPTAPPTATPAPTATAVERAPPAPPSPPATVEPGPQVRPSAVPRPSGPRPAGPSPTVKPGTTLPPPDPTYL